MLENINDTIICATLATLPQGKKHVHQRRLKNQVMQSVKNRLLSMSDELKLCSKFNEIINIVKKASQKGFGELAIYDTALRIGSFLNIYPGEVYLHAGTLKGARAIGLNSHSKAISLNNIPANLKSLKAYEIEDFLCIYKNQLQNTNNIIIKPNNMHVSKVYIKKYRK